ncbi:MAG TPA: protoporphyrinogen oxidase [Micromonosporaceae bacterium]|nr:protoporphyrinogen oxidase [Micromonosporaceae bacterium]
MRVAVIGAGITGLAAAHRLVSLVPGAEVVLVDGAAAAGGKLRTGELAGGAFETGAEMFLTGDPGGGPSGAVRLARAVGLGDRLVGPATLRAALAVGGTLTPLPGGTLMGVPADLSTLDGVARPAAERDRDGGGPLLAPEQDVAVGDLVRRRLGDEVVDRLVDPLLGGVYAGHADAISLRMSIPALARAATIEHTLVGAARTAIASRRFDPGLPVFSTVPGGVGRLVAAVLDALQAAGVGVRLGLPVRELARTPAGWRLVLGATRDPELITADAVVLAVPAAPAVRLLATAGGPPGVALDYASVALVGLALPAADLPELSGLLVPASEGYAVKAATFFDRKWAHLRRPDGVALVRMSLGRAGEEWVLQRDDAELARLAQDELARLLRRDRLPEPIDVGVHRWGGALPQYPPGHADRVARLRAALPATLAVAGAAYDGVGIPACIASGLAAADAIVDGLRVHPGSGGGQ